MKSVIFDLDGTLLDTFPGIMRSANDAAEALGYERVEDREKFFPFTGMPLSMGFPTVYGMSAEDTEKAPKLFMEKYAETGCLIYEYYDGMLEVVERLHGEGIRMGVSTLKTEDAARRMIDSSRYAGLFDSLHGNTPSDDAEKHLLIGSVLEDLGAGREESLFVGDTVGDMLGSEKAGVEFLGVSWGFGSEELEKRVCCSKSAAELEMEIREKLAVAERQ